MALACLREFDLPILHKIYCGNITDITLFGSAITKLIKRYQQIKKEVRGKLVLVFDKGNNLCKNIESLEKKVDFVSSLVPSYHKDLLRIKLEQYQYEYKDYKVYVGEKENL